MNIEKLKEKVSEGNIEAINALATYYMQNGPKEEGISLLKVAVEKNSMLAMYNLGLAYERGDGIEQDLDEARKLYEKAADLGDHESLYKVANFVFQEDKQKGFDMYVKAANLGSKEAMAVVGYCYGKGDGAEKNPGIAFNWFKKAAFKGHALAANQTALMYENGIGTIQDYDSAFKMYKLASELGSLDGTFNLARCLSFGIGCQKDTTKAAILVQACASQGYEPAVKMLKK